MFARISSADIGRGSCTLLAQTQSSQPTSRIAVAMHARRCRVVMLAICIMMMQIDFRHGLLPASVTKPAADPMIH